MVRGHLRQQEPGVAAQLEVGAMNAQAELLHAGVCGGTA